jgi:tetratricopeptide (TPR) repeat protein
MNNDRTRPLGSRFVSNLTWRGALGLLVGLVVLIASVALAWRPIRVGFAASAARRAVTLGQWEQAGPLLDEWIQLSADAAEPCFLRARAHYKTGNIAEAARLLDRAQWLGFAERPIYRLRALMLVLQRKFIEAEPILLHLMDESSEPDPEVDEAMTRVFLETYRLDAAARVIERWIRDAPDDARPYLWWTETDRRLEGDKPEAIERHYRKALELDPSLDEARIGLADTLRDLHKLDEAATEYKNYIERKPDDPLGHLGLAQLFLDQGDASDAAASVDRALKIAPDNVTAIKLRANLDLQSGDHASALGRLDRVIRADPLDVDPLYKRSLLLARLGRRDEALADKKRLEQLRQEQAEVVKIRDRLNLEPSNNEIRLEMAQWMFDHGRDDQAIRWLRNILSSVPKHTGAMRLLAAYHGRRGETGLANYYRLLADSAR